MGLQVVAHRGASHDNAEHTLAAYVAAMDAGADALECDVRLTADGHLVCVHDRDLRRVGGRGLVSTMELADLSELDVAAWKRGYWEGEEEPDRDEAMDRVLTLRALMEAVRDHRRPIDLAIETKHPTRYGGLVEQRLAEMLADFGWHEEGAPVRVMSFSYTALQRVERMAPGVRLVQLIDKTAYWPMLRRVIGPDWVVGPGMEELRAHPRLGQRIRDAGHELHVWVVNTEEDLRRCQRVGASAVITDRPDHILQLLGRGSGTMPG